MLICAVLGTAFVQSWDLLVVLSLLPVLLRLVVQSHAQMALHLACGARTATFHQVVVQGQDLYTN